MGRSRTDQPQLGQVAQFLGDMRKGWADLKSLTSRTHKQLVLGVIIVGALFRISQLWQGITYDEAFTCTFYAPRQVSFILSDYTWPNNHLLHTLLVKISMSIFGTHLWSVRLPALLAGILVMPLFYLFVRAMFNRYVALLTLAFVAGSGALIEYSALARGYSLTWLFMVAASMAGRHLAKRNNLVSAVLVALFCALGMWAVPTMVYPALAIYIWLLLYMATLYKSSLNRRLIGLLISFLLFVVLSALAYTPVIITHSLDQLLHHPTLGESTWAGFVQTHQEKALELWVFFNDTAATWVSLLGFVGLGYAAYISSKYRIMVLSILLASVPLVLAQAALGPPQTWAFVLFNLHLSSGIAVFYALKFVQEKMYAAFTKRMRSALAAAIIVGGMGFLGLRAPKDRLERFDDAANAAAWFVGTLKPGDTVQVLDPNDAPFEFHLMAQGIDPGYVNNGGTRGQLYALVSPAKGQTVGSVLLGERSAGTDSTVMVKVKDWRRLEIWKRP
jgi:4-amino-4-deoxy-L-arabinose transferase-like glycosyltransferase